MANLEKLEEKFSRKMTAHEKTARKLAVLQARFEAEERALREHKERVNVEWVRKFAAMAEKEDIQVSRIDAEQLMQLVKENKDALLMEPEAETADVQLVTESEIDATSDDSKAGGLAI